MIIKTLLSKWPVWLILAVCLYTVVACEFPSWRIILLSASGETEDFASRHHDNLPIDMVLNDISRHYRQPSINKSFELIRLFQNNEMTDALLSLLKDNCAYYMENQRVKPDLFGEIDKMMIK